MQPSAADLLEALREPGESYESLAARLPISLSTVNRWKKRSPRDWDTIMLLLDRAGWLSSSRLALGAAEAEAAVRAQGESVRREAAARSPSRRTRKSA